MKHHYSVEGAAEEDEDVEDFMHPKIAPRYELFLESKKDDTSGIGQPTSHEEAEHARSETGLERGESDHDEPAHSEVENDRESGMELEVEQFDSQSYDGQSPDNAKERPTPACREGQEKNRRIGARDEHGDESMIKSLGKGFGAWPSGGDEVVASTCEVKQYHTRTKKRVTNYMPSVGRCALDQENYEYGYSSTSTEKVKEATHDIIGTIALRWKIHRRWRKRVVDRIGFEPMTLALQMRCSSQLS